MGTVHDQFAEMATSRRRLIMVGGGTGAGALVAVWTAACGAETPARQAAPVTVTYLNNLAETAPEGKAYIDVLTEYNQTNTDKITVRLDEARQVTDVVKLLTLSAAGTPPDFARAGWADPPTLAVAGATLDPDQLLKKDKQWAKQRADIYPEILDRSKWGGKLTSVASTQNITAMIYSTTLLQRAGVPEPKQGWTWNDFRDAATKASKPPGTWGLSFKWIMAHWQPWLGSMGGGLITPDRTKFTINTPEALEATEFIVNLVRGNLANAEGKTELYRTGNDATVFEQQGHFRIPTLRGLNITNFGVIHHPAHPVKKIPSGSSDGHDIVLFKGVPPERQDAAGRVVLWMNGPAQARTCIKAYVMPVSKSVNDLKEMQDFIKTDPQFKAYVDMVPLVKPARFAALPSYDEVVNKTINPALTDMYQQKVSVRDGLAELQRRAQQLLDKDLLTIK